MATIWKRSVAVAMTTGLALVAAAVPALAALPANDTEAGAIEVTALPFVHSADTSGANGDGPRFCSNNASVFYRFTPTADVRVQVDTLGSEFETVLAIYTRDTSGAAHRIGCNAYRLANASGLRLRAHAGVAYFLMVGACCGDGGGGGGPMTLTVSEVDDVELQVTSQITLPVTVDPATGLATISGTVTCNERSAVYLEGMLRQLRDGLYVARGWYWTEVGCVPGAPASWSAEIDTDSMIAFAPGSPLIRTWDDASDGFGDWLDLGRVDLAVQLAPA